MCNSCVLKINIWNNELLINLVHVLKMFSLFYVNISKVYDLKFWIGLWNVTFQMIALNFLYLLVYKFVYLYICFLICYVLLLRGFVHQLIAKCKVPDRDDPSMKIYFENFTKVSVSENIFWEFSKSFSLFKYFAPVSVLFLRCLLHR